MESNPYVDGNPLVYADPTGLQATALGRVGAAGGFAVAGPPGAVAGGLLGFGSGLLLGYGLDRVFNEETPVAPEIPVPGALPDPGDSVTGTGTRQWHKVTLVCRSLPLLIRMVNESHRLVSLERLPKMRDGSLYVVRNSELLSSFHKDALGIYESDPLIHLAIITDEWIDLIVNDLPELKIETGKPVSPGGGVP